MTLIEAIFQTRWPAFDIKNHTSRRHRDFLKTSSGLQFIFTIKLNHLINKMLKELNAKFQAYELSAHGS